MISVLLNFVKHFRFSLKTAVVFSSPSLSAVFNYPKYLHKRLIISEKNKEKDTCEKIHKRTYNQRKKNRYQNASFTVEASIAFPIFFFAVLYLIQMFSVLRAELVIAQAGITSAREAATYSYVAERLADGECVAAEKILELFDQKIVRDVAMTGLFHARCDKEILKQARVGQGYSGIWVNTEQADGKVQAEIYYKVQPSNVLTAERGRFYVTRLVYRNWTGEGGRVQKNEASEAEEKVYMTEHGTVYHVNPNCTYINIKIDGVLSEQVGEKRNESGAKYYACEFCSPKLKSGTMVYITKYGTRFHVFSTCSAIERNVRSCSLKEVEEKYRPCSKCGVQKKEGK